jgi:hypothetical protein
VDASLRKILSEEILCARAEARQPYVTKTLGVLGAALLMTSATSFLIGGLPWILFLAVLAAAFPVGRSLATYRWSRPLVTLGEGELRIVGAHDASYVLPVAAVKEGWEHPANGSVLLRVDGGREITIVPIHRDDGERLLAHARVAPDQRAIAMPLRRTLGAFTIGLLAWLVGYVVSVFAMASLGPISVFVLSPLVATIPCILSVWRLGNPRVIVGSDGVRTRGLLHQRFVPHGHIDRINTFHSAIDGTSGVRIGLRDGSAVVLPVVALGRDHLDAVVRRIERARELALGSGTPQVDALARGDRSMAEWRNEIERLAVAQPGFRERALGREDFERVLADPNALPDQRVGAAMALRVADPDAAKARVRVAALAVADEHVRRALLAAAEGEPEEIESALRAARSPSGSGSSS